MRTIATFGFLFISILAIGQADTLVNVNISTGQAIDILQLPPVSEIVTAPFAGKLPLNNLPKELAALKKETRFTSPELASKTMIVSAYPAGTTVQLLMFKDKKAAGQCSGSMVAPNIVLTAAHCFVDPATRRVGADEIIVASAGTNTIDGSRLASHVRSAFMMKSYFNHGGTEDIMLLELEDPIGEHTGWVGMSSRSDSTFLDSTLFHKFSFPAKLQDFSVASTRGRQLHYNYGSIGMISDDLLGIKEEDALNATPGQSGSSLLYVDQGGWYSVGVAIYSRKYQHQRITKTILESFAPVVFESIARANTLPYILYPNPIRQSAVLKVAQRMNRFTLVLLSPSGEILRTQQGTNSDMILIDRGGLARGEYAFRLQDDVGKMARGVIRVE